MLKITLQNKVWSILFFISKKHKNVEIKQNLEHFCQIFLNQVLNLAIINRIIYVCC